MNTEMKKPNIKFKSLLQGIKNIEERNAYFEYLSDKGKRLEIAWEFMRLVEVGILNPAEGHFWNGYLRDLTYKISSKEVQELLISNTIECTVCERGGLMYAQICLGNSIDGYDDNRDEGGRNNIKGFCIGDFNDIESEYENSYYGHPYENRTREKMLNILCNILVNGNFNTDDKTNYLI